MCFAVRYVEGHTENQSFVKLTCPITQNCFIQFFQENGCFDDLPPCSYTLSATDFDAVDIIDTMPAVLVEEIVIQAFASTCTQFISDGVTVLSTLNGAPRGITQCACAHV